MPRGQIHTYRVQRHFSPLSCRSRFSPERLLTPPPTTFRISFPLVDTFILSSSESPSSTATIDTDQGNVASEETCLILKPSGEVARPGRHGYTLREVVAWDPPTYSLVQVYFALHIIRPLIHFLPFQNFLHELAESHLRLELTFSKQLKADLRTVYSGVSNPF
jgi:hypothetical protein